MTISVVIIEDHILVRTAIKKLLNDLKNISVMGEASTGEEGLRLIRQVNPNIAIVDLDLPGIGGLEITRRLNRLNNDTKIIIITAYENDIFPTRLLQLGVAGYLTKSSSLAELSNAIHAVHEGKKYLAHEVINQLALKNLMQGKPSLLNQLNNRELEFMILIAKGVKAKQLAEKYHLSAKTVNGYRNTLFKKLAVKNDVELAHLAIEQGLIPSELLENEIND